MTKLEQLIEQLCPNGVEYKKIGEIVDYEQPSKYLVKSTDYDDEYNTPVLTAGQTFILGYTDEIEGIYQATKENPVIIFDDFTAAFKWVDFPFKAKSSAMKMLKANEAYTSLRYIFHIMSSIGYQSDEHKRLWISIYSEMKIPIPPLEVQAEIVRILDKFTELTTELTTELANRKKQFEYYRDNLLSFATSIPVKRIGEITKVFSAARVHKGDWTAEGVPFFRSSDVISAFNGDANPRGKAFISYDLYERLSQKSGRFEKDDILITGGGTIGIPYIIPTDDPLYVKDADLICVKKNDFVRSRFLYHYFLSNDFRKYLKNITHDATIAHYTITQIENTPIPVPSLSTQDRLINVLDNFEAICSDLNSGLPAEIEARQKQYEYYRDKLLTFSKASEAL